MVGHPDIFFPDCSLAVFVDGCFWHGLPEVWASPKDKTGVLEGKDRREQTSRPVSDSDSEETRIPCHEDLGTRAT